MIRAKLGDHPVAFAPTDTPGTVALIHERRKADRRTRHDIRPLGPREYPGTEHRALFSTRGRRKHD